MANGLLASKLRPPTAIAGLISRTRVITRINGFLMHPGTAIVISAPPGYGKTSAVAEWAQSKLSKRFLTPWLSLDAYDNNAGSFLAYLQASIDQADQRILKGVDLVALYDPDDPRILSATLIDALRRYGCPVALCLDDFQHIDNPRIWELLDILMRNAPENFHLVLIGRTLPPIFDIGLQSNGTVALVDQIDLRLSDGEIEEMLARQPLQAPGDSVTDLVQRTEGWPIAVRLELLSGAQVDGEARLGVRSSSTNAGIGHLLKTYLASLDERTMRFLIYASLFETFCASLVATAAPPEDLTLGVTEEALARLVETNAFISPIAMGDGERWYRLHALFREEIIRMQGSYLTPAALTEAQRRAADWLRDNGYWHHAIEHALLTGDNAFAAECLEETCIALSPRLPYEKTFDIDRWFASIPESFMAKRPSIYQSYALHLMLEDLPSRRDDVDSLLRRFWRTEDGESRGREGSLVLGDALITLAYDIATGHAKKLADDKLFLRECAEAVPAGTPYRCRLFQMFSYLRLCDDDLSGAFGYLEAAAVAARPYESKTIDNSIAAAKMTLLIKSGRYADATVLGDSASAEAGIRDESYDVISLLKARIALREGRLTEARDILGQLDTIRPRTYGRLLAVMERLRVYFLLDDREAAREEVRTLGRISPFGDLAREVLAFSDAIGEAEPADAPDIELAFDPCWDVAQPSNLSLASSTAQLIEMMRAARRLNSLNAHNAEQARRYFERALETSRARGLVDQSIDYALLLAWGASAQGSDDAATYRALVVEWASKVGRLDLFSPVSPVAMGLDLKEAIDESGAPKEFANAVRSFRASGPFGKPVQAKRSDPKFRILTKRETELLKLVATGLSNQQIADELGLSQLTIKSHLYNAFQKLEAKNRTDAVFVARQMGLIP
ncbi:LuxR C-terminal-related transcriptional regulator [Adlercreutzia sp. ZJ138]|uniref:LuxR C-terminal-related transcriptional regulator n=1 Tax=Adlercreutzia sp. ZJ138 TaxID=2709405 RepID=UPI0013ED793A|nr:LuxR C-terminal-related transcriptional regulator [Adlercreutzia sp. ZJ138]